MKCSACLHENDSEDKFCAECGSPLIAACESCGAKLKPVAKFCTACGKSVDQAVPVTSAPLIAELAATAPAPNDVELLSQPRIVPDGERRQLTVMFCDMVGFTELSARVDPEVLQEIIRRYEDACAACITRYEGYVYQRLGDGIVAFFGYPLAHEGEAERAIRAGLAIIESIAGLAVPETGHLEVRIGIATGVVVVAAPEKGAVGEPVNLAARLQGVAQPGSIVISESVRRLAGGAFTYVDLGPQTLKGISQPVGAYCVAGTTLATSRFEAATHAELTPLVGREHEIAMLLERWQLAQDGEGQVVLLAGDPGIGKSRIVNGLVSRLEIEGVAALRYQCSPYHVNSAFFPIIESFERTLLFERDESVASKTDKLETLIVGQFGAQRKDVRFVAGILSLPTDDDSDALPLTPQKHRDETIRALVDVIIAAARRRPIVMLFEDAHWADPTSVQMLDQLISAVRTIRLLIVLTHRPEFQSSWSRHGHVTSLNLSKLTRAQSRAMIAKLSHGKALPTDLVEQILGRKDGVPLFVEELTTAILESGELKDAGDHYDYVGTISTVAIPATLQDSLLARLDRLGTAKEIAQLGATLGREFSYELMSAVSSMEEAQLQEALSKLVEAEVLYQQGAGWLARFTFKHALIQDAAYQMLLKGSRQQFHARIARVLDAKFPETRDAQPELIAHHYTEAGLLEQAVRYWQHAGEQAVRRFANIEALKHLAKALVLAKTLPDTAERIQRELALELAFAAPLIAITGYAAPEVGAAYERARLLCQQIGDNRHLFTVLRGLWVFYAVRCELSTAREFGEELLRIGREQQDPAMLVEAHQALAQTLFHQGEFVLADEHSRQGTALYDPAKHHAHVFLYGADPGIACLFWGALALWFLGYPDQALARSEAALNLAREIKHPLGLTYGFQGMASVHQFRREGPSAQSQADAAMKLSAEQGLPFWLAFGMFVHGWALSAQGQGAEGISQMRDGIAAWEATGAKAWQPYFRAPLAEECWRNGRAGEGLLILQEASQAARQSGERTHESELLRLEGELRLAVENHPGEVAKVEALFAQAIDVAQRQQAKSLELRAAMSLSRLWQSQERLREARELLAPVYSWFTEGFDTKDMQEAKALIEELSTGRSEEG